MKEELEANYVIILIDMQKLIINIWDIMIKVKNLHIFNIGMKIIDMVGFLIPPPALTQKYFQSKPKFKSVYSKIIYLKQRICLMQ